MIKSVLALIPLVPLNAFLQTTRTYCFVNPAKTITDARHPELYPLNKNNFLVSLLVPSSMGSDNLSRMHNIFNRHILLKPKYLK